MLEKPGGEIPRSTLDQMVGKWGLVAKACVGGETTGNPEHTLGSWLGSWLDLQEYLEAMG